MRHLLVLFFGIVISFSPEAQTLPTTLTKSQMEADFDTLVSALKEAHGGLYRFAKRDELDAWFTSCRKKLPASATKPQFGALLREAIAPIRDGHNRLDYDRETTSSLDKAKLLPFRLLIQGQRLMVIFNDSPTDRSIKPGDEILSINGRSSGELLRLMYSRMTCDGFIETGKQRVLERTFASQYWLQIEQTSRFIVRCKSMDGKEFSVTLDGVTTPDRVAERNANPVNASALKAVYLPGSQLNNILVSFSADNKTAFLRIRGFEGGDFISQLDDAFAAVRKKGSTGMILDLRGNGGGVDMEGAYLVSQFASKPFRYFDHIRLKTIYPSFTSFTLDSQRDLRNGTKPDDMGGFFVLPVLHPGVEEQKPADEPFSGNLVVLIDGNTFSTAADVCAVLRGLGRATFVGEETGGCAEGNTSGLNARVTLPNSGHSLRVQMYGYWNSVKALPGRGTLPDITVDRKIEDLLKGTDRQREKGEEWLNTRR